MKQALYKTARQPVVHRPLYLSSRPFYFTCPGSLFDLTELCPNVAKAASLTL